MNRRPGAVNDSVPDYIRHALGDGSIDVIVLIVKMWSHYLQSLNDFRFVREEASITSLMLPQCVRR